MVHQPTADVLDVVFQVCQIVGVELQPAAVAAGKIIAEHMSNSWGKLPPALEDHADREFVQTVFTIDGLKGLIGLRRKYVVGACLHAFDGRISMSRRQLETLLRDHDTVLDQMDGLCPVGVSECDTLSTAYGTAFNLLLTKGKFSIDDVTDDCSSNSSPTKPNMQKEATGTAAAREKQSKGPKGTSSDVKQPQSSEGRLVSFAQISHLTCGHDVDESAHREGYPGILFSTESLHELRSLLAVDMMLQSRSIGMLLVEHS